MKGLSSYTHWRIWTLSKVSRINLWRCQRGYCVPE